MSDLSPPDPDDSGISDEDLARARGWKPLAEYTGDPANWRDFPEFLAHGESQRSILVEENRRMAARNARMSKQIESLQLTLSEQAAAIGELRTLARRADEQGYSRAIAELKAKRAEAVEAGDKTAFDQIEEQIDAMATERAKAREPATPAPKLDPTIQDFVAKNPWYTSDEVLNRTMIANYDIVQRKNPDWTVEENLAEAKRRTMTDYPERFPRAAPPAPTQEIDDVAQDISPQPRRPAATVARPSGAPPRQPRQATGWDAITDLEERHQCQYAYESIKRADPAYTVEEYLETYNDPRVDVLEQRRRRSKP